MRTIPRTIRWAGIALAAFMSAAAVMAQDGGRDEPPKSKKEKLVQFQMAGQKWDKVIQFLVDNGDFQYLNPSSHALPKTAFTFIGPAKRMFSITEVFDTINTALMKDNLLLLRRNDKLILVKANDAIPEIWVPRITPDDLPNYGHTDIVLVVVSPKYITGKDYVSDVKNILGPFGRVTPLAKTNKLLIQDTADNIRTALKVVGEIDLTQDNSNIAVVPLAILEAEKATKMLEKAFGDPSKGGPFLDADVLRNAVIVRGTSDQIRKVKDFIKAVEKTPDGKDTGNVRIFTLEKGSAVTLAEEIKRTMKDLRNYDVELIFPGSSTLDLKKSKPKAKPAPEKITVAHEENQGEDTQLFDPRKGDAGGKRTKVSIAAFGNKMIVTSDDQEALKLAQELVILYTRTAPGEGDFQVMRLTYAGAVEVSRMLDEFFNGTTKPAGRPTGGGKGGGKGGGRFGGGDGGMNPFDFMRGMGGSQTPEKEARVRVVADPATNSILVKAAPLDMLTIRNRLLPMIDTNENDSLIPIRTQEAIELKFASANDILDVLRDVYRESMNNNPRTGVREGFNIFSGGGRTQLQNLDAQGNPRGVTLSIGVDEKTNSIIVACPDLLYEDITKLVKQLDVPSKQVIEVKQVVGVDPSQLQQAIDAIQGRKTNNQNGQNNNPFGTPFFRPGGGGTFVPGGGGRQGPGAGQQGGRPGGIGRPGGGRPGGGRQGGSR